MVFISGTQNEKEVNQERAMDDGISDDGPSSGPAATAEGLPRCALRLPSARADRRLTYCRSPSLRAQPSSPNWSRRGSRLPSAPAKTQ
jgi:hypothetical protein